MASPAPPDTDTPPPAAPTAAAPTAAELNEVLAKLAEFAQLKPQAAAAGTSLEFLRDVPITITAKLGHTVLPIGEVLKLGPGAVVELEEAVSQPVELTVRGVPFATGEIVVVDDHFAVRIKALLPPKSVKPEA